jgi:diacylglycerol kinase family enzyme
MNIVWCDINPAKQYSMNSCGVTIVGEVTRARQRAAMNARGRALYMFGGAAMLADVSAKRGSRADQGRDIRAKGQLANP